MRVWDVYVCVAEAVQMMYERVGREPNNTTLQHGLAALFFETVKVRGGSENV